MLGGVGKDTITPVTFPNEGTGVVHASFRLFGSQRCPNPLSHVLQDFSRNRINVLPEKRRRRPHDFQEIIRVL